MADPTPEQRRLSFGAGAADYDTYRPGYPADAVGWALGARPLRVVDLGAGTGLMSATLVGLGHHVLAVEPDPGMRERLAARAGGRVTVLDGSAERIPLPDRSVDAIVTAQAFHWFDHGRAVPEMARVLVDGGVLAVVWNVRDDDVAWVNEVSELVGRFDARSGTRDLDVPEVVPVFTDVERAVFHHAQPMDADGLVGLVSTFSYVALSQQRDAVLARIRAIATEHPDLAGRATFAMPYDTVVYRAVKA